MSQQSMDLRRSMQLVRQRKIFLVIAVMAGVLAGVAYAALKPSLFTSDALVVVPQNGPNIATEVVIATSNPVLSGALANIHPAVSLKTLQAEVQAKSPAPGVITVSAQGRSAAEAESIANAVADRYTSYVGARSSPVGHVAARILEPAASANDAGLTKQLVIYGLAGAVAGALIGFISALAIGRGDRRLRERDDIANAIGVPVLGSFPVGHPSDAAGWGRLLKEYDPSAVHAWRLRKVLRCLRVADPADSHSSLTILSLSADPGALALGPQLAVFAASLGIPTVLVVGPQQDPNATAALRTACVMSSSGSSELPRNFRTLVSDDDRVSLDAPLTVVVAAVDPHDPQIHGSIPTDFTLIGVSAGVATGEQLARLAVAAAADGRETAGILVADPEPIDRTTGRVPYLGPPQRRLPTRLVGVSTEGRP